MAEHMFLSKDEHSVRVRPMQPEDAPLLVDLFEHMGPDSRYLRFNLSLANPDSEMIWEGARRLAQVDPDRDGAWLALIDLPDQANAPVAAARYVRIDEETAEAALAVRDDLQNKGIGTKLLAYLVERAREAGIQRMVATVHHANRALLHILKKSSLRVTFEPEGSTTTIVAELVEPTAVS